VTYFCSTLQTRYEGLTGKHNQRMLYSWLRWHHPQCCRIPGICSGYLFLSSSKTFPATSSSEHACISPENVPLISINGKKSVNDSRSEGSSNGLQFSCLWGNKHYASNSNLSPWVSCVLVTSPDARLPDESWKMKLSGFELRSSSSLG